MKEESVITDKGAISKNGLTFEKGPWESTGQRVSAKRSVSVQQRVSVWILRQCSSPAVVTQTKITATTKNINKGIPLAHPTSA